MTSEHLKMCECNSPRGRYSCARCRQMYCVGCDRSRDGGEVKTVVRYCQDWRCQREKKIERGELVIVQRPAS